MIKITVDTHTHTNVSSHAFSTLEENMAAAKKMGLEGIAMTNHGPDLGDGPKWFHFNSAKHLPKYINGVRLLTGAEVDIMDEKGRLDIKDELLKPLDIVIASFHTPCFAPNQSQETVTKAWLNTIDNENVNILGHMGDGRYMCDYEAVVKKAKEKGKIIEINNHSFRARAGSKENCKQIALLCKKHSVPVVLSTDAHFSGDIGVVDDSKKLLEEIDFPEDLILNTSLKKLCDYLNIEI